MFRIEKDVPVPVDGRNRFPFDRMEIGDSTVIKGSAVSSLYAVLAYRKKKYKERYKTQNQGVGEGIRVWRIG